MPLERNLDPTDESCPDCGRQLDIDHHDRYWCRNCGEQKPPDIV